MFLGKRVVWGLLVLCLVGAVGIKPLVRWVDPDEHGRCH